MNWDRIQGNWKQVTGKANEQWGKLTEEDFDALRRRISSPATQDRDGLAKEKPKGSRDR